MISPAVWIAPLVAVMAVRRREEQMREEERRAREKKFKKVEKTT